MERIVRMETLAGRVGMVVDNNIVAELRDMGFFSAPASKKYHGNYDGGLFDHSYAVAECLIELTERNGLIWERRESPFIVGMFHDLCKCDQYCRDENGEYVWNDRQEIFGHGDKSVMLISRIMSITYEEMMAIRYHMGAFTEKSEWSAYTTAVKAYPNVLWTHHADMVASHIEGI